MELLRFEKKQLMLQWQSSLIGLTRRDEVSCHHGQGACSTNEIKV